VRTSQVVPSSAIRAFLDQLRGALRRIAERARRLREPAFIFVGNSLEGHSPSTIEAVVSTLAAWPSSSKTETIETRLMPNELIDNNAPSLQRRLPALPKEMPHGLIVPPQDDWNEIASSEEKMLREHGFTMNAEARVRELNRHTLNYYFDYLGQEVAYRETPQGPDVLAVGDEEILDLTKDMSLEEQLKLRRWLP
jgi:hypothetical protein